MTKVNENIAEVLPALSDKLLQYLGATEELLAKYGSDVAEMALTVLKIEAAGNLLTGLVALVICIAAYKSFPKATIKQYNKEYIETLIMKGFNRSSREDSIVRSITGSQHITTIPHNLDDTIIPASLPSIDWSLPSIAMKAIICGTVGSISLIVIANTLFSIWNWVGLFWPEAYAIHKFILS